MPWAFGRLPDEVCGVIKGRSADTIHDLLMTNIDKANGPDGCLMCGGKVTLDIQKCFDTIDPFQAIAIWDQWGAPEGVTRVLREFYQRQVRWVEFRGAVAQGPLGAASSILQGCPASPLLLAGIMSI